ncbi:Mbov_0396 family ICE element transmembrane protein [Spiroplasma endosymbiont of Dilophus febrilis]|uniref:Mbov_0396 family ICE element transmembrane protein n=1 Tax=Spiroplasma endosymbiont of Dilophus febrilis TaxID=3066292 RepID=UPI00313D9586
MYLIYIVFVQWPKVIMGALEKLVMSFVDQSLLDHVFSVGVAKETASFKMAPLLLFFAIVAGVVIIVSLISNFITAQLSVEPITMKQKVVDSIKNSAKAAAVIVAIPILFFIFKFIVNMFQEILNFGFKNIQEDSLYQNTMINIIHDMGWIKNKITGEPGILDVGGNYNVILPIVGFVGFAVCMGKLGLLLITRVFRLVFLYMLAPFAASKMTTDGGRTFHLWKEEVINNFILVLGMFLAITITRSGIFLLIDFVDGGKMKFGDEEGIYIAKAVIKLIIIIAGLSFMLSSQKLINIITKGTKSSDIGSVIKNFRNKVKVLRNDVVVDTMFKKAMFVVKASNPANHPKMAIDIAMKLEKKRKLEKNKKLQINKNIKKNE